MPPLSLSLSFFLFWNFLFLSGIMREVKFTKKWRLWCGIPIGFRNPNFVAVMFQTLEWNNFLVQNNNHLKTIKKGFFSIFFLIFLSFSFLIFYLSWSKWQWHDWCEWCIKWLWLHCVWFNLFFAVSGVPPSFPDVKLFLCFLCASCWNLFLRRTWSVAWHLN